MIFILTLTSAFSIPASNESASEYLISTDSNTSLKDLKEILKNYEINSINQVTKYMKFRVYKVCFKSKVIKKELKKLKGISKVEENKKAGTN